MARPLLAGPQRMPGNVGKMARRLRARAFTLIELMIVVAIVGILSVIGVVGYRKLVLQSKISEATGVIGAIRIAQEDYKVERGVYADIGNNHCPSTGLVTPLVKTQWDRACNGGTALWSQLPVHIDGPVQFGYATTASGAPNGYGFVNMAALDVTKPWYVVHAQADLDGVAAVNTELVATSQSGGQIFTRNEGQ